MPCQGGAVLTAQTWLTTSSKHHTNRLTLASSVARQVDGTCSSTGVLSVGSVTITLTTSDGPTNDNFGVAYIISTGQQIPTMTTAGSTSEAGEPRTNGRSVWYRYATPHQFVSPSGSH